MNTSDTAIHTLYASHQISGRLLAALKSFGVDDLRELAGVGLKTIRLTRGWGKVLTAELAAIAEEKGIAI